MKINLGSGYKHYTDYINVDDDINCNPDFLCNLEKDTLPFDNDTMDRIIAYHVLEHIGEGYIHLLQEIYRICKNGAIIDIRVPHHGHEVFVNDPTHKRPITVEGFRLFSKKVNKYEIETGGTSSTLGLKYNVDFEIISFDYIQDQFYTDIVKTNTAEQNERLFREALNTTIETHIKLTVIK